MAVVNSSRGLLTTLRKYSVCIFFPAFTATTIYADLSHTRRWKQSLADAKSSTELLTQ